MERGGGTLRGGSEDIFVQNYFGIRSMEYFGMFKKANERKSSIRSAKPEKISA